ncbi:MAG: NAD(P)-dependent oxidoreductase [Alphaproteobacteria bacterium]|nr:NAD(P)-dependent oxidoreductase [Alphaproteobacteria bacterium]
MNVLVTGGTGFLGAHLMATLAAAGHTPLAYDAAPPSGEMLSVCPALATRFRLGEIGDLARLLEVCRGENIEAIVHAAGMVGLAPSLAQPLAFYQTNIIGLVHACEAARQLKLAKLIAISSNAAYHKGQGEKLVETDPPFSVREANPAAHYGTSKMAGEAIGMAYAQFQEVDFLALRITAIYGFGMRQPMYIKPMVENAVRGAPTRFATGGPMRRDYTHVQDCCDAIVLALQAPRLQAGAQRVLNVAAGKAYSAAQVAALVRRVIPSADIEIGDTLSPLEAENAKMRAPLDIAAARRVLGWSPRWALEEGIRQYADQFRVFIGR